MNATRLPPYCVGLTGGIGSGKSTVAAHFVRLGADLIDTDAIAGTGSIIAKDGTLADDMNLVIADNNVYVTDQKQDVIYVGGVNAAGEKSANTAAAIASPARTAGVNCGMASVRVSQGRPSQRSGVTAVPSAQRASARMV